MRKKNAKNRKVYRKRKYRKGSRKGYKLKYDVLLKSDHKKCIVAGLIALILFVTNIYVVYTYHEHTNEVKKLFPVDYIPTYISIEAALEKGISAEEAKKYIGQNVFMVLSNFIRPYAIYGVIVDVIKYEGEWYVILKTHYNTPAEQFIKCKDIHYIRERYKNE